MHCYPNYYNDFKCIGSKCTHNCCIGWEIDIDDDTLGFYRNVSGAFGQKLKDNIDCNDTAHFVLDSKERCPFLNSDNLCDIISTLSKEHLCEICTEHPRFHNELPNRVESGLGMCCEEAARIILSQKEKTVIICEQDTPTDDEIIILRDKVIDTLQDRSLCIDTRIENMLKLCNTELQDESIATWCDVLLSLERMDECWGNYVLTLKNEYDNADLIAFDEYMKEREHEYEQLCVYFVYRHFANAPSIEETKKRAAFAAFVYKVIYALGAVIYQKTSTFDFEAQVELCRLFSSEIEYSDENIYGLYDIL